MPWSMEDEILFLMDQADNLIYSNPRQRREGVMILGVDWAGSVKKPHKSDIILSGNLMMVCMGESRERREIRNESFVTIWSLLIGTNNEITKKNE